MTLPRQHGFSIFELLIVLVVVGVVAVTGFVLLGKDKNASDIQLSQAAKDYPRNFWVDDLKGGAL